MAVFLAATMIRLNLLHSNFPLSIPGSQKGRQRNVREPYSDPCEGVGGQWRNSQDI